MKDFHIRRLSADDHSEWLRMRQALWPKDTTEELAAEAEEILNDSLQPVFVLVRPDGKLGGFLEAGIRKYAEGCETSPVGFIEGWYVDPDLRRQGWGGKLFAAAEEWARGQGLKEMGSDTWLDNEISIEAHKQLGYEETERLVHFLKRL